MYCFFLHVLQLCITFIKKSAFALLSGVEQLGVLAGLIEPLRHMDAIPMLIV